MIGVKRRPACRQQDPIIEAVLIEIMFGRQRQEPEVISEPASDIVPDPDIEDIKRLIVDVTGSKFRDLTEREQRNRDRITSVNDRCSDNNSDIRKIWAEKDNEKSARDQEIADLRKANRLLKAELAKKADKPKPAKSTKA